MTKLLGEKSKGRMLIWSKSNVKGETEATEAGKNLVLGSEFYRGFSYSKSIPSKVQGGQYLCHEGTLYVKGSKS